MVEEMPDSQVYDRDGPFPSAGYWCNTTGEVVRVLTPVQEQAVKALKQAMLGQKSDD